MEARDLTKIVRNMMLYKNSVNKEKINLNETEFEMIRYISKREFRTFTEVKNYLNVDKGLVTRMSKKLESLGYLTITTDSDDLRKKLLYPTKKALEIKNEIYDEEVLFYDACLRVLSNEEKEVFLKLVDKVYLESKRLRKCGFEGLKWKSMIILKLVPILN